MTPSHQNLASRLRAVTQQIDEYNGDPKKQIGRHRSRGRSGIRTELYLDQATRSALDRLVLREKERTGRATNRTHLIRRALAEFLSGRL